MNWKTILVVLAMVTLAIPILPAHAITVPNPDQFTMLTLGGPRYLDPAMAYDTASGEVIMNVYQSLVDFEFVYLDRYVAELADWWPGYGENPGNAINPMPPHPHEYTTGTVDPYNPVGSSWTRKAITYELSAWTDNGDTYLGSGDSVTMSWVFNATMNAKENLVYSVDKFELLGSTYKLTLIPTWIAQTWYFHIRENVPWQDKFFDPTAGAVVPSGQTGYVTPFDVEYSIERGMVLDRSGGPQWMFYEPLTTRFGSRTWNIPTRSTFDPTKPDETGKVGRIIDDAIESNATHVWFNLAMPYAPFMQILSQTWGGIVCANWTINLPADPQGGKNWNASWHQTPGDYWSWIAFNKPKSPGPMGFRMLGCGPYYLDYIDTITQYWRLRKFDGFYGGWDKPHVSLIVHQVVAEWATRKARFLSDDPGTQADTIAIERSNVDDPDLLAAISANRVRYMANLASLSADGLAFSYDYRCYDFDLEPPTSYWQYIGDGAGSWIFNRTLFSDRDLRLAFIYAFNVTQYIHEVWLDEAVPIHDPVIYGIAFANATKHALMYYNKDVALATYHFKMAWGGRDPDGIPNSGDEIPGEIWNKGFKIPLIYSPDVSEARRVPAEMMEYVIENEIEWPAGVTADVMPIGVPWDQAMEEFSEGYYTTFICGWLADFPHPHNWVMPYMSIYGDFSYYQCLDYGRPNITKMNWHPQGDYKPGPGGYYINWEGKVVNDINNTYVEDLIGTGIGLTNPVQAQKLYTELEDIFYAEALTLMLYQPSGRRYERTWVQGWFYNSIYPGPMFYGEMRIWKQDPATVTRNLEVEGAIGSGSWTIQVTVKNTGQVPEFYTLEVKYWKADGTSVVLATVNGWLRPGEAITSTFIPVGAGPLGLAYRARVWQTWQLPQISEKKYTQMISLKPGDLGSGPPPKYWKFDGKVDGYDLALFINAQKFYAGKPVPDPFA
jgi:peptide/nickel transport system substrate-binding protein